MSWIDDYAPAMLGPILRNADRLAGGRVPRLSILIYHRVLAQPDPMFPDLPDAGSFERHMRALARMYQILPLSEAVRRLADGSLPPQSAAITFDDGYADNAEVASPLLKRLGLHATFFVSPAFLNGGRMWNDTVYEACRRLPSGSYDGESLGLGAEVGRFAINDMASRRHAADSILPAIKHLPQDVRQERVDQLARAAGPLPTQLMMTDDQVRLLTQDGMEVGAHTMTHPILAKLDKARAREEIAQSRSVLQQITQTSIDLFAYPNGKPHKDYDPADVQAVRELGFTAAVSTAWGVAHAGSDRFQLPRFTPWDRATTRFMLRLAKERSRMQAEAVPNKSSNLLASS